MTRRSRVTFVEVVPRAWAPFASLLTRAVACSQCVGEKVRRSWLGGVYGFLGTRGRVRVPNTAGRTVRPPARRPETMHERLAKSRHRPPRPHYRAASQNLVGRMCPPPIGPPKASVVVDSRRSCDTGANSPHHATSTNEGPTRRRGERGRGAVPWGRRPAVPVRIARLPGQTTPRESPRRSRCPVSTLQQSARRAAPSYFGSKSRVLRGGVTAS